MSKYGIAENHKFVLIDEDLQRLKNTLPFMPQYSADMVETYPDDEVEQGFDGNWYEKGHAPKQPMDEAKVAKLAEINSACNAAMKEYVKDYPDLEIDTFDEQLKEAMAYSADNTAETPVLTIISEKRGLTLSELVQRVLAKADEFKTAAASAVGQRQALNDRLQLATTVEEVQAIEVNIVVDPPTQTKTKKSK